MPQGVQTRAKAPAAAPPANQSMTPAAATGAQAESPVPALDVAGQLAAAARLGHDFARVSVAPEAALVQRKVHNRDTGLPAAQGKPTPEQEAYIRKTEGQIDGLVQQAHNELINWNIKEFIGGTEFEGLLKRDFGEDDPRRKIGYVIEERTYALVGRAGIKFSAQHSVNFPGGTTRPDIILTPDPKKPFIEALIDITAEASKDHILAKDGGAWFKNSNIIWASEVLYPTITDEQSETLKTARVDMSPEDYKEQERKNKEELETARKQREAEAAKWAEYLQTHDLWDYALAQGFVKDDSRTNTLGLYKAKVYLYNLGVDSPLLAGFLPRKKTKPATTLEKERKQRNKLSQQRKRARPPEKAAQAKTASNARRKADSAISAYRNNLSRVPRSEREQAAVTAIARYLLLVGSKAKKFNYPPELQDKVTAALTGLSGGGTGSAVAPGEAEASAEAEMEAELSGEEGAGEEEELPEEELAGEEEDLSELKDMEVVDE